MAEGTISKINVNGKTYNIGGSGGGTVTNITYSELVALKDAGNLIPEAKYRITDYVTSFKSWKSGNHQFDVIVTACANNAFYAEAQAALHEGDDYFANSDLNSWKLWYDITNNTDKHKQANSSGKGTILRMIDEYNNDADYDFKNAMFEVSTTDYVSLPNNLYFYTFSLYGKSVKQLTQEDISDMSINPDCKVVNNTIFGLSIVTCDMCCIGGKTGFTASLNPKICNNEIILPTNAASDGVLLLSDGINNSFYDNYIKEFKSNNPIGMQNCRIFGSANVKIPYKTSGIPMKAFNLNGSLDLEIQAGSIYGFTNVDIRLQRDSKKKIIIPTLNKFCNILLMGYMSIDATKDITIIETDIINNIIIIKDDTYAAFDLLGA